jgi:DNA polymerase-3 subunit alpha
MDFCMNRRGEVIDYVTRKYGRENVAQIITFGTMAAKAAIKDVGRAMDVPYADVDRIAKMVPTTLNIKLDSAIKESPALQQAYENDAQIRQLIDTAKKLEGLVRNAGVHAAGVVISPRPLTDLVPLYRTKNDEIVTAFDMVAIEKMGLLKMDFLGLTTLTILDDALKLILQTRGERITLEQIPLSDQETYIKVFHSGLTSGIFQFESHGMRDVLRRYQPVSIEDLTALNALYRPGPIQGGMIDYFIDRKHGRKKIEYELPELEEILKETFGVIVYQEHVMQIANRLAGYSMGEADLLRRAMGKKKPEEMAQQRERFVEGAVKRGYPPKKIERIFDLLAKFAEYGFPKAHSAAYALLAYHTAYLKTHYPVEFMAALLTSVTGSTDDVVKYINECREMGIAVEPPDINVSDANFTPHGPAIRFGLAAVKNVGHNAIESIVSARKELGSFKSIYEFCEKVDLRLLNKRVLESLIKSGAMDSLGKRAQLMAVLDKAIELSQKAQRDAESGQHGLFGVFQEETQPSEDRLPDTPDWDEHTRLTNEKEILGFFITGHPLDKYRDKLEDLRALSAAELCAMKSSTGKDETLTTAGIITNLRVLKSKRGDFYAQGALEDLSGSVEMLVFPDAYKKLQERIKGLTDVPVLVRGGVRIEEGANPKLTVSDLSSLEEAKVPLPRSLRIRVPLESASDSTIDELHLLFSQRKGEAKVLFDVERAGDFMVVMEAEGYNVMPDRTFITRVEELCGRGAVRVIN